MLNPALVLQGPWVEALWLTARVGLGTLFICGGLQGYQAFVGDLRHSGALQWPLRLLLIAGGVVMATPDSGLLPWSGSQLLGAALAVLLPTLAVAALMARRAPAIAR